MRRIPEIWHEINLDAEQKLLLYKYFVDSIDYYEKYGSYHFSKKGDVKCILLSLKSLIKQLKESNRLTYHLYVAINLQMCTWHNKPDTSLDFFFHQNDNFLSCYHKASSFYEGFNLTEEIELLKVVIKGNLNEHNRFASISDVSLIPNIFELISFSQAEVDWLIANIETIRIQTRGSRAGGNRESQSWAYYRIESGIKDYYKYNLPMAFHPYELIYLCKIDYFYLSFFSKRRHPLERDVEIVEGLSKKFKDALPKYQKDTDRFANRSWSTKDEYLRVLTQY